MAKILAVGNRKGGVGKTTLVAHLAFRVAAAGKRALVIDLDSQCDISQLLTGDADIREQVKGGVTTFFEEMRLAPMATMWEGISLLHANQELDAFDKTDVEQQLLTPAVRNLLREQPYDFVIVDTPPSLGIRHVAPIVWADRVIVPMKPDHSSVARFMDTLEVIEDAKSLNPGVSWTGVFNLFDRNALSHRKMVAEVRDAYSQSIGPVFSARNTVCDALQLAPARPVWDYGRANKLVREEWKSQCGALLGFKEIDNG